MLTEESFHGNSGTFSGNWAAAMEQMVLFAIPDVTLTMSDLFFLFLNLYANSGRKRKKRLEY